MTTAIVAPAPVETDQQWLADRGLAVGARVGSCTVRISGIRYVVLTSGNSGRTYWVRADARGCGCLWSQRAATPCSHRLAVELAATLEELAELAAPALPRAA